MNESYGPMLLSVYMQMYVYVDIKKTHIVKLIRTILRLEYNIFSIIYIIMHIFQ